MIRIALFFIISVATVTLFGSGGASAHNWAPDDGCRVGPSPSGYFFAAGPASDWGFVTTEGWGGCFMYTRNTTTTREQWGEWYLPVTGNYNHVYKFYWYSPATMYCSTFTDFAHYHAWPNGHDGAISVHKFLDQSASSCGNNYCNHVYTTTINGSPNGGFWDLWDLTYEDYLSKHVIYDIVCFYE